MPLSTLDTGATPVGMSWGLLPGQVGGGTQLQPTPGSPNQRYPTNTALVEHVFINEVRPPLAVSFQGRLEQSMSFEWVWR